MNFGHGELGFGAWPSAKSYPVAEYCTVFSASTPIAFDAVATTVAASSAAWTMTAAAVTAASTSPDCPVLTIVHLPFLWCALYVPLREVDRLPLDVAGGGIRRLSDSVVAARRCRPRRPSLCIPRSVPADRGRRHGRDGGSSAGS